ncbi:MAG: glycoside hydrolase family 2 TIM barrel-domain containing protein [Faecousia sp.]
MKWTAFNDNWYVRHVEEAGLGTPVTLPHDAMLSEPRTEIAEGGLNVSWFEGRDYVYSKKYFFSEAELDRHNILEFEGVYRKAEVFINGKKAMFRPYGYTNFYVELDGLIHPGENTLEVIARNADQPNSRWYSGAGIYRPVKLWYGPKAYIAVNGVKIRTVSVDPAVVEIRVKTSVFGTVKVQILDGETLVTETSGESSMRLSIPEAKLWSVDTPHLYTARVLFGADTAEETFGIRSLSWGGEGLRMNEERVILRGACIHHDNGLLGAACHPDAVERKLRILKENGYNAIRSAHNPCSKAALEVCDRIGMLVMDEYIDHWYIHKTQHDYVEFFDAFWKQDLTDMVDKDYNHPSVILYSTGNEVAETAQPKGIALAKEMTQLLHSLDGTRPVTCGVNIFFNFLNSIGFGQYSDEKAAKEAERAARAKAAGKKAKERSTGSKFFNDMAGLLGADFMKIGATLHGSDVTTREAFANMDIAGYNYGEKRYRKDLKKYPDRLILGSETFCFDAYRFWELAKENPRLIGDFVWAGFDYLGEVMVGSWEYGEYAKNFDAGPGWMSAGSGRIDLTGKPLGEALYTKVAFELDKGPYIAVRPLCHESSRHSPSAWKMTNAQTSWSWRGWEGKRAHVEVYARAAQVELLLNGRPVGRKAMKNDCLFTFRVPYENGKLEAVSYGPSGNEIGRNALVTAGEETMLRAVPEESTVRAGHLCFIRLQYTDEKGTVKPCERGLLEVNVEGGELAGLGSACPYYELDYRGTKADTYYGEALAIVESGSGGTVTLTVSDGTHNAQTTVTVVP